jgi:hypothetical protein
LGTRAKIRFGEFPKSDFKTQVGFELFQNPIWKIFLNPNSIHDDSMRRHMRPPVCDQQHFDIVGFIITSKLAGTDEFDDVDMLLYANLIRDLSHALLPRQINHGMGLRRLCVAALSLLAALPHCASNSGAPAANPQQFSLLPTILRISEAAGGAQTTQATRHGHMPHPCQGLGLKLGGYSAWDLSVLSILYYSYTIDEL